MDQERVKVIQEYKRPFNVTSLRGFFGLINYFRKSVPQKRVIDGIGNMKYSEFGIFLQSTKKV